MPIPICAKGSIRQAIVLYGFEQDRFVRVPTHTGRSQREVKIPITTPKRPKWCQDALFG